MKTTSFYRFSLLFPRKGLQTQRFVEFWMWGKSQEPKMQARILVVEDNPSHRALLKEICESFDFEVDLRENAEEALDAVMMFNQYAVIIVDVGLPGMSGLECASSVRKFEQRKNITRTPIIALSAIDELNMTAVSSSGIDDFIAKPFDPERLRKVLLCWAYRPQNPNLKLLPKSG